MPRSAPQRRLAPSLLRIEESSAHPSKVFFAVVVGCDHRLQNSSCPCDSYEREAAVE